MFLGDTCTQTTTTTTHCYYVTQLKKFKLNYVNVNLWHLADLSNSSWTSLTFHNSALIQLNSRWIPIIIWQSKIHGDNLGNSCILFTEKKKPSMHSQRKIYINTTYIHMKVQKYKKLGRNPKMFTKMPQTRKKLELSKTQKSQAKPKIVQS